MHSKYDLLVPGGEFLGTSPHPTLVNIQFLGGIFPFPEPDSDALVGVVGRSPLHVGRRFQLCVH